MLITLLQFRFLARIPFWPKPKNKGVTFSHAAASSGKLSHLDNLICFGINPFYHNASSHNFSPIFLIFPYFPSFLPPLLQAMSAVVLLLSLKSEAAMTSNCQAGRPRKMFRQADRNPPQEPRTLKEAANPIPVTTPPFSGALTSFKPRKHLCEQEKQIPIQESVLKNAFYCWTGRTLFSFLFFFLGKAKKRTKFILGSGRLLHYPRSN